MPPLLDKEGYWGERTATIDWCEKNYVQSYHVAELWNTVSNALMMLQALIGISGIFKNNIEKKFILAYMFLFVVGMGSWAFHMTLLYEMQLFDELPMVWGMCFSVYVLCCIRGPRKPSHISNPLLLVGLSTFAVIFTLLYLYYPLPVFQHSTFGILATSSYVIEISLLIEKKCKVCRYLFITSLCSYSIGFFLWNIDQFYCDGLTSMREVVPIWVSPVTQLHAWWHFLAGHGTYLNVLFSIHAYYDFHPDGDKLDNLKVGKYALSIYWEKNDKSKIK